MDQFVNKIMTRKCLFGKKIIKVSSRYFSSILTILCKEEEEKRRAAEEEDVNINKDDNI